MKNEIVVCAYHTVGYRCIEALLIQGAKISLIFTHEDSPEEKIWFQSVRALADSRGIPCLTSDINLPENVEQVRALAPDFIFSFYYRTMIKPELLEISKAGAINLHGSCLPRYRGRAPINWAVINGETETGATLHYMVAKPDAGDIIDQERVVIAFTDTAHDVFGKVTDAAVTVMTRSWPLLRDGVAGRSPMDLASGSYFGGRKPSDGQINWNKRAVEIYNLVRGVTHPYPGAFTYLNGKKVFVWQAWPTKGSGEPGQIVSQYPLMVGTAEGLLEIRTLQLESDPEGTAQQFLESLKTPITHFQEN